MSDSNGVKYQIDFITIRRKWRNSLKNCEIYSSANSIGSDHRIITAKIKLSLRISKKKTPIPIYILSELKNKDKALEYGDIIIRRFRELNNLSENTDTSIMYEHLINSNQ